MACDYLRENQICYIGSPQRTAKLIDEYLLKYETVTMQYFNKLMALVFLLGFYFSRTAVAQDSTVVPSKFWIISRMMKSKVYMGTSNTYILPVLYNNGISYGTFFGFYTMDGDSFVLVVALSVSGSQDPVVWSANPDNPVNHDAILSS